MNRTLLNWGCCPCSRFGQSAKWLLLPLLLIFNTVAIAQYCTTGLYSTGCTSGDDLDGITLGSYIQTGTPCGAGGYEDYTSVVIPVTQSDVPVSFSATTNYTSASEHVSVWIDWSNDGDFDDANEFILSAPTQIGGSTPTFNGSILFDPSNTPTGIFRMRVRVKYGGSAMLSTDACTSFIWGETHDYSVEVKPNTTGNCNTFTNFSVDSITGTGAKLDWIPGSGNTSFFVEYGTTGFTPGSGTTISGTYPGSQPPVILSGLTDLTTYDVYLGEICNSGADSVYFPTPQNFTTTRLCAPPANLMANNVTISGADISWSVLGNPASYGIIYGSSGFNPATGGALMTTTSTPTTLSGLTANTYYEVYLFADCGADGYSDTIGPVSFKTPCTSLTPITLPFTEDFESYNTQSSTISIATEDTNFACTNDYIWNYDRTGNAALHWGWDAHGGTQSAGLSMATSGTAAPNFVTLTMDMTNYTSYTGSILLSFWFRENSDEVNTNDRVWMRGSMSDSWIEIMDWNNLTDANNWTYIELVIDTILANNGQAFSNSTQIRWGQEDNSIWSGGDGFAFDDVKLEAVTCLPVSNFTTISVSDTSAVIAFDNNGGQYSFEFGPCGFQQGTGSMGSGTESFILGSNGTGGVNLFPNSCYDVYVIRDCGGTDQSPVRGPYTFYTECAPTNAPYYTGFETDSMNSVPECWDNHLVGVNPEFSASHVSSAGPPYAGSKNVRFYNYNNDTTMLISPKFLDMTADDKRVNFYARSTSSGSSEYLVVGTVSDFEEPGTFTVVDTISLTTTNAFYSIDITTANGYNGTHEHIALLHGATASFHTYYIDEFNYEQIPACAPPLPNTLGATAILANGASVFWGAGSQGVGSMVEIGIPGFTPGSGSAVASASVSGTVDTVSIGGLSPQTTYDFYMRDSCAISGYSPWVGPFTFTTACTPIIAPYSEDFESHTLGFYEGTDNCWTIEHSNPVATVTSGFTWELRNTAQTSSSGTGAAGDNTLYPATGGQFFNADVSWGVAGHSSSLVSPIVDVSALSRPTLEYHIHRYGSIMADLFVDVYDGTTWVNGVHSYTNQSGRQSAATAAYADTLLDLAPYVSSSGLVQVRFRTVTNGCCAGDNSLDDINFVEGPSCIYPTAVAASNVVDTAATLTWNNSPQTISNQVWFGPQGFFQGSQTTGGTVINVTGNNYLLDTLSDNTCYEFLVRSICAPGDSSQWVGPISFCTECRPFTMPYYESYDIWPLSCWDVDEGNEPWISYTGAGGDNWAEASFWSFTTGTNMVMNSPPIMISQNAQLRYTWSHLASGAYPNDEMIVRASVLGSGVWDTLMVRNAGAGNFNDPSAGNTNPGVGVTDIIPLDPAIYTGNYVLIQFWGNSGFGPSLFINDMHIEVPPTCPLLSGLGSTNVLENSADLYWTDNSPGGATNYQVEYGVNPFGSSSNSRIIAPADTFNLTGLTGGTGYCYWVREICTPGDTSQWVGPICFSTPCPSSYTAPYSTNFEGISIGNFTTFDNCWTTDRTIDPKWESEDATGANENSLGTGPLFDHTSPATPGGVYMYLETTGGSPGTSANLVSPIIDVSTLSNPQVSFWYHMHGVNMGKLEVLVDSGNGFTVLDSIVGQQHVNQSDPWSYYAIPLTGYIGDIQISFRGYKGIDYTSDMAIDDVAIEEQPSCPFPLGLTVSGISGTTATVNWNASSNAQSYIVEYGAQGYTPGTGTKQAVTTTTATIAGLPQNNLILDVYIRAYCSPGDSSNWVGPVKVSLPPVPCDDMEAYNTGEISGQSSLIMPWAGAGGDAEISTTYASSGTKSLYIHTSGPAGFSDVIALFDSSYTMGVHNVAFDFYIPTGDGGYYNILHNYNGAASVWAIEVYLDAGGQAAVNMGSNATGVIGTYTFNPGAWNTVEHIIDLDNDTAWIMINGAPTGVGWQFSLGSTNMADRFNAVNFYSAANAGQTPNMYFDDFCITPYVPVVGCPDPTGLTASNISCDEADLSWTSSGSVATSAVIYGPAGFNPSTGGTASTAAGSSLTITGLTPATSYDFYVVDVCFNGDTSAVVGPSNFSTISGTVSASFTETLNPPTATELQVDFDASASVGAVNYDWDFGDGGVLSGTNSSPSHDYSANGTYNVKLVVSGPCGTDSVTRAVTITGVSLYENSLSRSLSVYPNPSQDQVRISFDAQGSDEAVIRLRDLSGKTVMEIEKSDFGGTYDEALVIEKLAKGVYLLEIENGDAKAVRRIIKE